MLTVIVGTIFEYIAGLAVESLTDGFEGGEAYGFGLARLEYRETTLPYKQYQSWQS